MTEAKGWKPPEGSKRAFKSEYWKPTEEGETVVGYCSMFGNSHFGEYFVLTPVVVHSVNGEAKGYGSITVGINSWLRRSIRENDHKNTAIALTFKGKEKTPKGMMNTFDVYELTPGDWETEKTKYLADLPEGDDGGLPF